MDFPRGLLRESGKTSATRRTREGPRSSPNTNRKQRRGGGPRSVLTPAAFIRSGTWGGATAGGRAAFISTADVGRFGARILAEGPDLYAGQVFELTGPESLTVHEVAGELSRRLGRPVTYEDRTEEQQSAFLASAGVEGLAFQALVGLDKMTADQIMATVTPTYEALLGTAPASLRNWLDMADLSSLTAQA